MKPTSTGLCAIMTCLAISCGALAADQAPVNEKVSPLATTAPPADRASAVSASNRLHGTSNATLVGGGAGKSFGDGGGAGKSFGDGGGAGKPAGAYQTGGSGKVSGNGNGNSTVMDSGGYQTGGSGKSSVGGGATVAH